MLSKDIQVSLGPGRDHFKKDKKSNKAQFMQNIEQISLKSNDVTRFIIVFNGTPFYSSSGENSGFAGTWFPFFGIFSTYFYHLAPGWFVKPHFLKLTSDLVDKIHEFYPHLPYGGFNNELPRRFASLPCMLISSKLGGGLWNSEEGKGLKRYLELTYPQFYENIPDIVLSPPELEAIELENGNEWILQINEWLCAKVGVEDYTELSSKYHVTLEEWLNSFSKAESPLPEPEPAPVLYQHKNTKRFREFDLLIKEANDFIGEAELPSKRRRRGTQN